MNHDWKALSDRGWWTTYRCARCGWASMDKSGPMPCTDGPNPWCPSKLSPRECPHTTTHAHLTLPSVWGTPLGMVQAMDNLRAGKIQN